MAKAGLQGAKEFIRDVEELAGIAEEFIRRGGEEIVRVMTSQTKQGLGPGGSRFAPYSEAYLKRKKKEQGGGFNWLVGFKKQGSHMLDRRNFSWKVLSKTSVELDWTAAGNQGDYASVHNEGDGKNPKREWMHLEAPRTIKIIDILLKSILNDRADRFSAKWGRR